MLDDFKIGNVKFCCKRGILSDGEKQQVLSFTESKLLEILLRQVNEIVLKETLKEFAWQHTVVTDSSLTKSIAKLRKALAFFFEDKELILTIPRVGYKLVSHDVVSVIGGHEEKNQEEFLLAESNSCENTRPIQSSKAKFLSINIRNKILLALSVILIGGALFNFSRLITLEKGQFIANGYHITELINSGFTHKLITPVGMELTQELSFLLSQQKCDCLFFVDKISGHYNISYFDPKNEQGVSFILDEKNLIDKLSENLPQGEQ